MKLDCAHVLICRNDNIGDVVLTLPLAGYLKSRFPAMRIGFLVRGYAADVVRQCRAVDYVLESEALEQDPVAGLKDTGAQVIIFAKPDRRLAKAAKEARIAERVGTSHRLFHWMTCNRLAHFSRVKSGLHEAQLNFKLLKPLGIDFIPSLEQIPALYQMDVQVYDGPVPLPVGFNLVLHPKSNGNGREWPVSHFAGLARLLAASPDVHLFVTGSKAEGEWMQQNGNELLSQPNVVNACGRFTLKQLAAFIAAADGMIASGTGPLHMSAAFGQRTLGLFPPVKPIHPGRWAPLGERAEVLVEPVECAGCVDAATCVCMNAITPESVAAVVNRWRSANIRRITADHTNGA